MVISSTVYFIDLRAKHKHNFVGKLKDLCKAQINSKKCIGCSECILICPNRAIQIQWNKSVPVFMETILDVVSRTLECALRLVTISALSTLDDFSEARERLTKQIHSDWKFSRPPFLAGDLRR